MRWGTSRSNRLFWRRTYEVKKIKQILWSMLAGGLLVFFLYGVLTLVSPDAKADIQCSTQFWWTLGSTQRTICDGPVAGDGSWLRFREFWTPAHYVPVTCYGRYYISCSGGYYQERTSKGIESYVVFPDNVLPDEPGHLN